METSARFFRRLTAWMILGAIAACGLFFAQFGDSALAVSFSNSKEEEKSVSQSVEVRDVRRIEIEFSVGEIEIRQGEAREVKVKGNVKVKGKRRAKVAEALEAVKIEISGDRDLKIRLDRPAKFRSGYQYSVDLHILVPIGVDLDVELNVGKLRAQLELPQKARFRVNVGELRLVLPRSSAAHVDADVNVGDVRISGFEEQNRRPRRRSLVGARFQGVIGDRDAARDRNLKLSVNVGEIVVRGRNGAGAD